MSNDDDEEIRATIERETMELRIEGHKSNLIFNVILKYDTYF